MPGNEHKIMNRAENRARSAIISVICHLLSTYLTRRKNSGKSAQLRYRNITRPFFPVGRGWLARLAGKVQTKANSGPFFYDDVGVA